MIIDVETEDASVDAAVEDQLLEYITLGIVDCLDRADIKVPSEAADDVFQLALLRHYVRKGHCTATNREGQIL